MTKRIAASRARIRPVGVENMRSNNSRNWRRAAAWTSVPASAAGVAILGFLSLGTIAFFALLGWLARKPSIAAFWIGIVLFGLDTLIFLIAGDWVGVAFHALALFFLWSGLRAAREMKRQSSQDGRAAAGETASP